MAQSLKDIIDGLSLSTGLKLCLDAGDSASYNPSVQTAKWLDTSGNGYDFYRGSSAVGDAAEPTFNGTAGGLSPSEYWSFDGGDYFTYDTTNEAWMDNLHKDGVKLTAVVVGVFPNAATTQSWFGTNGDIKSTRIGARLGLNASEIVNYAINNGVNSARLIVNSVGAIASTTSVTINSVSYDESSVTATVKSNTTDYTETVSAIAGASSLAATYTMQIGAAGDARSPLASGAKLYGIAIWEGVALTSAQLTDLYNEINQRFNPAINPGLFSNTNSFYSPTVTQATSTQTLIHNRYDNDNTFYAPAVSVGAVTLNADLFTNGNTFYQPTVNRGSVTLSASLYSNTNEFYDHTLTLGAVNITVDLFANVNKFFEPNITVETIVLSALLFENANAIYQHSVSVVAPNQNLTTSLFENTNEFYAANLEVGAITLSLEIFVNYNELYTPYVNNTYSQNLTVDLFTNINVFYGINVDFAKYAYAQRDSSVTIVEMRENVQNFNRENNVSSANRKLSVSFRQPNVVKSRR